MIGVWFGRLWGEGREGVVVFGGFVFVFVFFVGIKY